MTKPKKAGIPWTNCRLKLVVSGDVDGREEDPFAHGVVARLHYTSSSHPAVRHSLQALKTRTLSIPAVALQSLVNRRGPDALIGCIPGENLHSGKLLEVCTACHDANEVLVCSTAAADLVLVPRVPQVASQDELYFVVYATNLNAVDLCERLRLANQVAVILDIDQTLVDATHVPLTEQDIESLEWVDVEVSTSTGSLLTGRIAHAPGSDAGVPTQDRAFFIMWTNSRTTFSFFVRVRSGWMEFRQFLVDNSSRFAPFICSKGKLEYVQLIWTGLDPAGRLLPRELWPHRIFSTFPDHLQNAADKTILSALGCASVTAGPRLATPSQIAAPVVAVDDSPDAYESHFSDSVLFVEEFRPSEAVHADRGSILKQVAKRLDRYWHAAASVEGSFAWHAAQSFATAILGAMQRTPMESPAALAYLQVRCQKQGESLWSQVTLAAVFENQVYVADDESNSPEGGSPRSIPTFIFERRGLSIDGECQGPDASIHQLSSPFVGETSPISSAAAALSSSFSTQRPRSNAPLRISPTTTMANGTANGPTPSSSLSPSSSPTTSMITHGGTGYLRPLISQKSLDRVSSMLEPVRDDGATGAGFLDDRLGSMKRISMPSVKNSALQIASSSTEESPSEAEVAAKTAEDLLTAALMMRC